MREELMGKKLGSVYKRHIRNDFRFEMMITERIALSFFVRQWRPLDPPRGVGSRVCMQRNVHAYARDAHFVLTYTCSQVYIGCERQPRPAKRILLCSPMNVQPRDHRVSLPSGPLHLNCVDREVLNLATGNCFLLSSFSMRFYTIINPLITYSITNELIFFTDLIRTILLVWDFYFDTFNETYAK